MSTTTAYYVFEAVTSGLFIPLIVAILFPAWLIGLAVKAMKSKDLT